MLQIAVDRREADCVAILLLHKTSEKDRIEHLKLFSSSSYRDFQGMIPEVLATVKDESLSDGGLVELVEASIHQDTPEVAEMYFAAHAPGITEACLRSKNCIPPPTASTKHFYFEITVLEDSKFRMLGLSFGNDTAPAEGMPGGFEGSWGYHGKDGHLFVEGGCDFTSAAGFGPSAEYAVGDVAGVGMNLEPGDGFCTLNGKKREVGTVFEGRKFKFEKLYPCVGVDVEEEGVGLHFVVNFGGSNGHPFKYMGPFV
ncbi:hypothetical protein EDB81DRAFT_950813 [Dactylonectria macrodidyma]|uniref:B30.2/SPRY domain-containing protein n=1 Tax=Dactylonectria macrodidyma TaxID=307937 RepID=A0A9P9E1S4_9HYPO|nr:hypothetical protein EDB81DRAFT_950813 [Dactylonectria macrodidyma]